MWRSGPESAQYVTWMNGDLGTMRSSLRIVITNNHPLQQSCSTNCSSNQVSTIISSLHKSNRVGVKYSTFLQEVFISLCSFSEVNWADSWSLLSLQLINCLLYSDYCQLSSCSSSSSDLKVKSNQQQHHEAVAVVHDQLVWPLYTTRSVLQQSVYAGIIDLQFEGKWFDFLYQTQLPFISAARASSIATDPNSTSEPIC